MNPRCNDIAAICESLFVAHKLRPGGGSHVAFERVFAAGETDEAIERELASAFASFAGKGAYWTVSEQSDHEVVVRIRTRARK